MEALISLLIQFLPKQVKAIELLRDVPEAITLVKELVAEVKRIQDILKHPDVPKTPAEKKVLDDSIAALKDDPYLQPEPKK